MNEIHRSREKSIKALEKIIFRHQKQLGTIKGFCAHALYEVSEIVLEYDLNAKAYIPNRTVTYLVTLANFNQTNIRCRILAASEYPQPRYNSRKVDGYYLNVPYLKVNHIGYCVDTLKKVTDMNDLPLYLGMAYTDPEIKKYLT